MEEEEAQEERFDWLERSTAWTMRLTRWHPALVLPLSTSMTDLIVVALARSRAAMRSG